jgi:uncharacterized repeat protein (TIGR04138 family)
MAAHQVLDQIRREIIESGRDARYRLGAYVFVLSGLEFCMTQIGEKRHVTGQELSVGLLTFAHRQFGPLVKSVFDYWGIEATDDFGYIVYNMIDIGVMSRQSGDRLEDFFGVADVGAFFRGQESFEIDHDFIKKIKGA